ncbi:GNAT family N-acetyltransferase [Brevibacillus reuszeri]|uniref:GNAT family N-acetyltransferase n=2 Tax=Brevibacillus reuszeri TaxID=54915 RepID=UPI0009FF2BA7|nr:GNAT family protein [Brevibacillus reuszeri]MED1860063.1 GNAT family protein [Brevibacillus reuszeri]
MFLIDQPIRDDTMYTPFFRASSYVSLLPYTSKTPVFLQNELYYNTRFLCEKADRNSRVNIQLGHAGTYDWQAVRVTGQVNERGFNTSRIVQSSIAPKTEVKIAGDNLLFQNCFGWVDLKNIDRANKSAELGIAIGDKLFWGKGYGASVLRAMMGVGFHECGLTTIWLRVDADNRQAIRSYLSNGFQVEETLHQDRLRNGQYVDRVRMSFARKDFERFIPED